MTAEAIYAALTVILSLVLDLVLGAKEKWESLPENAKRWGWLLGSVGVPAAVYAGKCVFNVNPFAVAWECTPEGLVVACGVGVTAYYLSQGAHGLAKLTGLTL